LINIFNDEGIPPMLSTLEFGRDKKWDEEDWTWAMWVEASSTRSFLPHTSDECFALRLEREEKAPWFVHVNHATHNVAIGIGKPSSSCGHCGLGSAA
jgi:hypothetical protein